MNSSFLEPKRDGNITVTATIQGKSATCDVKITAVPIEDFELEDFSVAVGGTEKALLNTTPSGISPSRFTWSVADHSIATIDQNGVATGIKEGETTVTAAVGDKVRTGKLTVKKTIVNEVTLSQTEVRFYKVGETLQLTATVKPDDASYPEITWSSSNAIVVSVDLATIQLLSGRAAEFATLGSMASFGQIARHRPQPTHLSWSIRAFPPSITGPP